VSSRGNSGIVVGASRVERNSALLGKAAVSILAESGWTSLSTRTLCARCGLTSGALYTRFESLEQLLELLWVTQLEAALLEPLDMAAKALAAADEATFVAALTALARPNPTVLAAVELVQAAMVEPDLASFFLPRIRTLLVDRTTPSEALSSVDAAVSATILFIGFGFVLKSRRPWASAIDLLPELRRYFAALSRPADAEPTPRDEIAEYLYSYPFDTGDERLDRVLQATAMTIGEVGYRRATVQRIARAASVSTGFIMSRFPTKLDLFITITEEMWGRGFAQISSYLAETGERMGPAIAEAIAWREMQNPVISKVALLTLETNRLAGFLPSLGDVVFSQEEQFFKSTPTGSPSAFGLSEMALGMGLILVAWFSPAVRDLPYVSVTAPLVATAPNL